MTPETELFLQDVGNDQPGGYGSSWLINWVDQIMIPDLTFNWQGTSVEIWPDWFIHFKAISISNELIFAGKNS